MLEKQRTIIPASEFAIKRFETLLELVFSTKKLTEDVVEREFDKSRSKFNYVFDLYNNLYHQIKSPQSQKVLDQIFAGKSIHQIMYEEKLSLDQVIFCLREIEMHMRRDLDPHKISFFPGLRSTIVSKIQEDRRENLQDLVVGYRAKEIAYRRGYKKKSIDESLFKFRLDARISPQQQQQALNRIHTMNLGKPDLIFLDRLFRLAVKLSSRQALLNLKKEKIESQTGAEANMEEVFNQVYEVVSTVFEQLNDFKQNVIRMKISGQSNTQVASVLGCKDYDVREAYNSSVNFLKKSIAKFIEVFDRLPDGIDIYRYIQLTGDQEQVFNLYFQGNTTAQIADKLPGKSQSSILHFLGRIRETLGLSVDQYQQIRDVHLAKIKVAHNYQLKLLQSIFPNDYADGLGSNTTEISYRMGLIVAALKALKHLQKVGGFRFSDPKFFIQHIDKNQSAYEVYKAQEDEKGAKGETSVAAAIKSTRETLQSVFDNLGEGACPKDLDFGKWLLLDKTQKQIYQLREEGHTHQEINDKLRLGLSAGAMASRIQSIYKLANA